MFDPLIEAQGLGKRYRRGSAGGIRLPRLGLRSSSERADDFWALKDVDLQLKPGDSVGIIGPNGAGKSTLLKILSRVTRPTEGRLTVRGRVGALIEVGAGFHAELSGRDNIFINGAILGMSRREVQRRFDEIVSFAELSDFIDTPVKKYSSGMYVRLGFAVAAHMDPDVLLVDEVLSVGDMAFHRKCIEFSQSVNRQGIPIVLVSHNLPQVAAFCRSCLLLQGGRVTAHGSVNEVIAAYVRAQEGQWLITSPVGETLASKPLVVFREVTVCGANAKAEKGTVEFDEGALISISYGVTTPLPDLHLQVIFTRSDGTRACSMHSRLDAPDGVACTPGWHTVHASLRRMRLVPDMYRIEVWATDRRHTMDYGQGPQGVFEVRGPAAVDARRYGTYVAAAEWAHENGAEKDTP